MGDGSPAQAFDEMVAAGVAALCGGGEEQFAVHVTHGEVASTVLAAALDGRRVVVLPADAERQLEELIERVEDGSQAVAVWQLLGGWRVQGPGEAGGRPAWGELSEEDRARVVVFLRRAADDGLAYAWEQYPPGFGAESPLHDVGSAEDLRWLYGAEYVELGDEEFERLHDLGSAL